MLAVLLDNKKSLLWVSHFKKSQYSREKFLPVIQTMCVSILFSSHYEEYAIPLKPAAIADNARLCHPRANP